MPSQCIKPYRVRVARFTRLDECGRVVYGENSRVVTDGLISVATTVNTSETEAINTPNADGQPCLFVEGQTRFLNRALTITFCNVDPDLYTLITGREPIIDPFTGDTIGWNEDTDEDPYSRGFAMETWSRTQGPRCAPGGAVTSGYMIYPFLSGGYVGEYTLENGAVSFPVTAITTQPGALWGSGPYNVQFDADGNPAPLSPPVNDTSHSRLIVTNVAPPEPMCGAQALNEPEMTMESAILDLTATLDFEGTAPTPEDPGFVTVDWGDGTDLEVVDVAAADPVTGEWTISDVEHIYDTEDTYTITATYYTVVRTAEVVAGTS